MLDRLDTFMVGATNHNSSKDLSLQRVGILLKISGEVNDNSCKNADRMLLASLSYVDDNPDS